MKRITLPAGLYRILEIAIGCAAAIGLAQVLGLQNSVSAGIITMLSLQDTKRETLRSAVERFAAFALATAVAYASFALLGYGVLAFGVYLLVFASLSYALRLQASLPISSVLVSHYWLAGHMQPWLLGNEAVLMGIGTGIGVLLNLFLPGDTQAMYTQQRQVERGLRAFLLALSNALSGKGTAQGATQTLPQLAAAMDAAQKRADLLQGNTLLGDMRYYARYVDMRRQQYILLERMAAAAETLTFPPPQALPLADFLRLTAESLHEYNDATALLDRLSVLLADYREAPLPQSRTEFEARATLYHMLVDTEHLLLIKRAFAQGN